MSDADKSPCPACGFLIEPRWLDVHQANYCPSTTDARVKG